jgi:NADH:ubiquinone oxidoreductase subunit E
MVRALLELKEYLGLTKRQTPLTPREKELASEMLAHLQDRQSSLLEFMEEAQGYK